MALVRNICLVVLVLLSSCSSSWHLKRAIKKDASILKDSIVQIDTLLISQEVRFTDTLRIETLDTIRIEKERLRIEIMRVKDTFLIDARCEADTIRLVEEVKVPQYIEKDLTFFEKHGFIAFIVSFVLVLIMILKK